MQNYTLYENQYLKIINKNNQSQVIYEDGVIDFPCELQMNIKTYILIHKKSLDLLKDLVQKIINLIMEYHAKLNYLLNLNLYTLWIGKDNNLYYIDQESIKTKELLDKSKINHCSLNYHGDQYYLPYELKERLMYNDIEARFMPIDERCDIAELGYVLNFIDQQSVCHISKEIIENCSNFSMYDRYKNMTEVQEAFSKIDE